MTEIRTNDNAFFVEYLSVLTSFSAFCLIIYVQFDAGCFMKAANKLQLYFNGLVHEDGPQKRKEEQFQSVHYCVPFFLFQFEKNCP